MALSIDKAYDGIQGVATRTYATYGVVFSTSPTGENYTKGLEYDYAHGVVFIALNHVDISSDGTRFVGDKYNLVYRETYDIAEPITIVDYVTAPESYLPAGIEYLPYEIRGDTVSFGMPGVYIFKGDSGKSYVYLMEGLVFIECVNGAIGTEYQLVSNKYPYCITFTGGSNPSNFYGWLWGSSKRVYGSSKVIGYNYIESSDKKNNGTFSYRHVFYPNTQFGNFFITPLTYSYENRYVPKGGISLRFIFGSSSEYEMFVILEVNDISHIQRVGGSQLFCYLEDGTVIPFQRSGKNLYGYGSMQLSGVDYGSYMEVSIDGGDSVVMDYWQKRGIYVPRGGDDG